MSISVRTSALLLIMAGILDVSAVAQTRTDAVLMQGNRAGQQLVTISDERTARAEYSYNDRDHGDHITASWILDAAGIPLSYESCGNDYSKAPVEEQFELKRGKARWRNRHESGEQTLGEPAFYIPANPVPEFYGVLARALIKSPNRRLALLPSGLATIEPAGSIMVGEGSARSEWFQYRIAGLDFMPVSVWLDANKETTGVASLWLSTIAAAHASDVAGLLAKQDETNRVWFAGLASALTRLPKGDLIIRNVRLFDPRDLSVTPEMSVRIRGERVIRIARDAQIDTDTESTIIDADARFLMPGLWDCHAHFDGVDGMLDIANGITSARDLANDTDLFLKRVARFDAGTEIGPRVLKAGIIDGKGPNAGPFKTLVDSEDEAIKLVDWYADHGYVQIKIYMSLKPELVPIIADRAHERGLRLSGHVPAFMSARQFVEAGADELQHFNYVELNFLYPRVQETTKMSQRFIEVGMHAREFTPNRPEVRDFIDFLRRNRTVIDPTMGLLEARLAGSLTNVTPGLEQAALRFPAQVRRNLAAPAYAPPQGAEAIYAEAIPSMLKLLKALHDAGVTIVPGTDALAGYQLHHELELYVRAGIAPAEVLRLATLTPAEVMGVAGDRGVIAPGKYADMVLIDGDPTRDIEDVRRIHVVVKGGRVYDPAGIERALGIKPRR